MVKVWVADVSPLCESGCYEAYYSALPDFRKRKADRLRSVEMRAQSAGVWSLWEKIRKEYGIADDAPRNFSHSGQYVMCAVETAGKNAAVGCDLEKKGELKLRLAKRFFCPEEYEMILDQDSEEKRTDMFYRYWVLKESFMKATGWHCRSIPSVSVWGNRRCLRDSRQSLRKIIITWSMNGWGYRIRWRSAVQMPGSIRHSIRS